MSTTVHIRSDDLSRPDWSVVITSLGTTDPTVTERFHQRLQEEVNSQLPSSLTWHPTTCEVIGNVDGPKVGKFVACCRRDESYLRGLIRRAIEVVAEDYSDYVTQGIEWCF